MKIVRRGFGEGAIRWVVTRGYSIGEEIVHSLDRVGVASRTDFSTSARTDMARGVRVDLTRTGGKA